MAENSPSMDWKAMNALQDLFDKSDYENTNKPIPFRKHALDDRYGVKQLSINNIKDHGNRIAEDMGVDKIFMPLVTDKPLIRKDPETGKPVRAWGATDTKTNQISLDPSQVRGGLPIDETAWTLAHELTHVAQKNFNNFPSKPDDPHHMDYKDFDTEFPKNVQAQKMIEMGAKPRKEDLARAPWLNDVVPLSSNKMAAPWKYFRDIPDDGEIARKNLDALAEWLKQGR